MDVRADLIPVEVPANPATPGKPQYVSDEIVEMLGRLGYRYLPLVPGSSFRGLHDSVVSFAGNDNPKILLCLHEEIAVALAQGYAKATGHPAAAAVHDLVGLMHASMAVFDAWADGTPLLILGGSGPELPRERRSLDWTHSASTQSDLVKPYVKWSANPIDESGTLESILQAHRFAWSAPTGPAYVTIDAEVQERPIDRAMAPLGPVQPLPAPVASQQEVDRAARLLIDAKFPVIISGRAGLNPEATVPLVRLTELLSAAYCDDRNFVAFPTAHPLNCSGDPSVITDADVILAVDVVDPGIVVGAYPGERGARPTSRHCQLIDISQKGLAPSSWSFMNNAAIVRDVELAADPVAGVEQVLGALEVLVSQETEAARRFRAERRDAIARRHHTVLERERKALESKWNATPIAANRMVHSVWEAVKDLPWVLALRNTRSWPQGIWQFSGAGQFMGHSAGGGVGYGPGVMVGVALAAHERGQVAVAIIGDGDLVMASGAIWTAVHYRLPLLIIVNNNGSFYNDEVHQSVVATSRGREPRNAWIGTRFQDPHVNFADLVRGYGASAVGPIEDPDDLDAAMAWAVDEVQRGRVALVDVRVERDRS